MVNFLPAWAVNGEVDTGKKHFNTKIMFVLKFQLYIKVNQ